MIGFNVFGQIKLLLEGFLIALGSPPGLTLNLGIEMQSI